MRRRTRDALCIPRPGPDQIAQHSIAVAFVVSFSILYIR